MRIVLCLLAALTILRSNAFVPVSFRRGASSLDPLTSCDLSPTLGVSEELDKNDDAMIQWELLNKHHAKGSWKGVWTSHDYIGDVIDEVIGSVDLTPRDDGTAVEHTHTIVIGAKTSDCETCFDSMDTKTIPIATYSRGNMRNSRGAAVSMVHGPRILRSSGVMATELILKHGDGRVRVTLQHAPVWEQGVEPGSCPPQGLKLFRCMISREALRSTAPTPETEGKDPPAKGNPVFFRSVPPFYWHKKWSGTSWTWGPNTGNRGWEITEMEETDAWHGITPVEQWNLRVGPLHVQCPRVITDVNVGVCRIAWLPDDETLLRMEAGIQALQPRVVDDDRMVGFEPPTLSSLRCDMMKKVGELENVARPSRDWGVEQQEADSSMKSRASVQSSTTNSSSDQALGRPVDKEVGDALYGKPPSGMDSIRDNLSL